MPQRSFSTPLVAAAAALIAACSSSETIENERLTPITNGISRDSVMQIIGRGQIFAVEPVDIDRLYRGFRQDRLDVMGSPYAVLWFHEGRGTVRDSLQRQLDTPILFQADTVVSVGWSAFDKFIEKNKVQLPPALTAK